MPLSAPFSPPPTAVTVLAVDLEAVVANWRALRDRLHRAECAAMVKADAYGMGAAEVAPALADAGCTTFFVAQLEEGAALRPLLPLWPVPWCGHGKYGSAKTRPACGRPYPR